MKRSMVAMILLTILASTLMCSLYVPQIEAQSTAVLEDTANKIGLDFVDVGEQIIEIKFTTKVIALDEKGNPDPNYRGTVSFKSDPIDASDLPEKYEYTEKDAGVHEFTFIIYKVGEHKITVYDDKYSDSIIVKANPPMTVLPEYPVGAILVFALCFGAFAIFVKRQKTSN